MSQQWVPPLPPGFEARWDPNQKAYFFINHTDKSTTWQDPRFRPPNQHNVAAQYLNTHAGGQGVAGQAVPMNTMYKQFGATTTGADNSDDEDFGTDFQFGVQHEEKLDMVKAQQLKELHPTAPMNVIESYLRRNENNLAMADTQLGIAGFPREEPVSHPPPKGVDMIERLRAMFPSANPGLVQDILHQCQYHEKNARAQLESIGYKPQFTTTANNKGSRQRSTSPEPKKTQNKKKAQSPKPAQSSPTPKTTLSETQKHDIERKTQAKFPTMDAAVVSMALQVCEYDESRIAALLNTMKDDPAGGSSSRPSTSGTSRASKSRSPSPKPLSPVSLEPVAMSDTFDLDPVPSSSRPSTATSSKSSNKSSKSSQPSTGKSSTGKAASPKKTTTPSGGQKQQQRAKQVTKKTKAQPVISKQPESYVSANRTQAQGPDPSLRTGPNKDILLSGYTVAKGRNSEYLQGPDPDRVSGPMGAIGPDKSLHLGPQFSLRMGSNNDIPGGSGVHVTAI